MRFEGRSGHRRKQIDQVERRLAAGEAERPSCGCAGGLLPPGRGMRPCRSGVVPAVVEMRWGILMLLPVSALRAVPTAVVINGVGGRSVTVPVGFRRSPRWLARRRRASRLLPLSASRRCG